MWISVRIAKFFVLNSNSRARNACAFFVRANRVRILRAIAICVRDVGVRVRALAWGIFRMLLYGQNKSSTFAPKF